MKIWNDDEVKALFENVEKCKKENVALVQAFSLHAKKFSRKPNSVRNYYYHEVDNLSADKVRAAKLRIDITKHEKLHFKNFDKVQEGNLFDDIDRLTKEGLSVRSACLKLSGGDLSLMTRFQNKYQNMKKKLENSENFKNLSQKTQKNKKNYAKKELRQVEGFDALALNEKIIPFKVPRTLTEADINSLFLGLVRLVKRSAQDELAEQSGEMKILLEKKERELENLRNEFEKLKKENSSLQMKIRENLRTNKKVALEKHLARQHAGEIQKAGI